MNGFNRFERFDLGFPLTAFSILLLEVFEILYGIIRQMSKVMLYFTDLFLQILDFLIGFLFVEFGNALDLDFS